jgi:hypothetical protein
MTNPTEFSAFDTTVRKVLSVSREELMEMRRHDTCRGSDRETAREPAHTP